MADNVSTQFKIEDFIEMYRNMSNKNDVLSQIYGQTAIWLEELAEIKGITYKENDKNGKV